MATIARMNVALGMDSKDFDRGIKDAGASAESFASKASKVGAGMTAGITLPILGIAAAAVKMSTDFNASMANIASLGVPAARVEELKTAVQDMAVATGKSTDDLAGGLYQVVSAFGDTSDTAKILEINAKGAAAGLATTSEAIALTSSVTKGYGDTSATAVQQASDLALMTVQLGQTTFPELAASIGAVVPLAANLGVAQEELFATMATATGVTGNASAVSTQLRGVLQSLMAPTENMIALQESLGYSSGEAMLKGLGLQGTMAAVTAEAAKSGAPLQSYIGSIEGQTLALAMGGPLADSYAQKLAAMGNAAGATDTAFLAQTQGINASGFAMQQLTIQGQVLLQKLGDGLAPALSKVMELLMPLADAAVGLADQFANADAGTQTMIVGAIALVAALGPLMTMLPAIGTAIGILTGPIGLVVAAVALLGAAWATNFGGIQEITAAAGAQLAAFLTPVQWVTDAMLEAGVNSIEANEAITALPAGLQVVATAFQDAVTFLTNFGTQLQSFLAPAIDRVQEAFAGIGPKLAVLGPSIQGLQDAFAAMWAAVQPIISALAMAVGVTLAVAADVGVNGLAAVIGNLPGLIQPIIAQVTATINLIATTFTGVVNLVTALINGDWTGAWNAAQGILAGFETFFNATFNNISSFATAIIATITDTVTGTLTDMGTSVEAVLNTLLTVWTNIFDGMKKTIQPVLDAIAGLKKGIEDFAGWITSISIPNPFAGIQVPTITLPSLPSLPGFASGGAVTAGVPAIVGERGAELFVPNVNGTIIPHNELGGAWADMAGGGNGAGVTLNNYGPIANNIDIAAIAYAVSQYQSRRRA